MFYLIMAILYNFILLNSSMENTELNIKSEYAKPALMLDQTRCTFEINKNAYLKLL